MIYTVCILRVVVRDEVLVPVLHADDEVHRTAVLFRDRGVAKHFRIPRIWPDAAEVIREDLRAFDLELVFRAVADAPVFRRRQRRRLV